MGDDDWWSGERGFGRLLVCGWAVHSAEKENSQKVEADDEGDKNRPTDDEDRAAPGAGSSRYVQPAEGLPRKDAGMVGPALLKLWHFDLGFVGRAF